MPSMPTCVADVGPVTDCRDGQPHDLRSRPDGRWERQPRSTLPPASTATLMDRVSGGLALGWSGSFLTAERGRLGFSLPLGSIWIDSGDYAPGLRSHLARSRMAHVAPR